MRCFIIAPLSTLILDLGVERSLSEVKTVSSKVGNFANSLSSKSALDIACCSSILALDSACAVKRHCRVVEEIDIVKAVASDSSIFGVRVLSFALWHTKNNKCVYKDTEHNNNYQM